MGVPSCQQQGEAKESRVERVSDALTSRCIESNQQISDYRELKSTHVMHPCSETTEVSDMLWGTARLKEKGCMQKSTVGFR